MLENKVAKGQKHGKRCWKQLELNTLGLLKRGIFQKSNLSKSKFSLFETARNQDRDKSDVQNWNFWDTNSNIKRRQLKKQEAKNCVEFLIRFKASVSVSIKIKVFGNGSLPYSWATIQKYFLMILATERVFF